MFAIYQQILLEARIYTRSMKCARKEPRTCIRVSLRYGTTSSASVRTWASPIDAGLFARTRYLLRDLVSRCYCTARPPSTGSFKGNTYVKSRTPLTSPLNKYESRSLSGLPKFHQDMQQLTACFEYMLLNTHRVTNRG